MTKEEERELAHILATIGGTLHYVQKSLQLVKTDLEKATKRLRFLLKVEGKDEKLS